ncbi:MAG: hypothetical protein MJY68_06255 [Bacteroidaceae bacterium]|nr:hypothetical protein [Bacteroidaceae bacterium]
MKKVLIFAAFAALFALTACQEKEPLDLEQGSGNEMREYPVFTASIDFGDTKAWTQDGAAITWSYNEEIKIKDKNKKTATYIAEKSGNSGKFATLKVKEGTPPPDGFGEPPFTATINSKPSYIQDYNYFAENDKLYLKAESSTVVGDGPADYSLVFQAQNALLAIKFKFDERFEAISVKGSDANGKVMTYTLLVDDKEAFDSQGWKMEDEHTYLVAVEAGKYDEIKIMKSATNVCVVKANPPIEVVANDYVPITLADDKIQFNEVDVLPGFFTVDQGQDSIEGTDDDIVVSFSKGNLKYLVQSQEWKLYDEQYEFCNTNVYSGNHSDIISLFSWGYDPNKSIVPDNSLQSEINVTLSDGQHVLSQSQDWGDAISDENTTWRTLTSREWQYLICKSYPPNAYFGLQRKSSSPARGGIDIDRSGNPEQSGMGLKFDLVTVCGVAGCLAIVPDNWDVKKRPIQSEYSSTSSPMTWEQAQCAGLVCLPPAGYRDGKQITLTDGQSELLGYYWSSSNFFECVYPHMDYYGTTQGVSIDYSTSTYGYLYFTTGVVYAYTPTEFDLLTRFYPDGETDNFNNGKSVRLVTNLKMQEAF